MYHPAFLPITPLPFLAEGGKLQQLAPCRLSCSIPTGNQPRSQPASTRAPAISRRALLATATAAALSVVAPQSPAQADSHVAKLSPTIIRDFLYDSTSGSFIPPSALPTILQDRFTGRMFDRCVVAAEIHDNACTHAAQLATLSALLRIDDDRRLIVGFEQFHRNHDPILDAFVAGDLSLRELLVRTEWPSTWGFDPKLYIPLFNFCRANGITMRGLNAPLDLTARVASVGIQGLSASEKAMLPRDMDLSNNAHFSHFCDVMAGAHHAVDNATLARLYQVQVLWEEWMSESVARALASDSSSRMVALVGSGHVENRFGLPDRIQRRSSERPYTILPVPVTWSIPDGGSIEFPDINGPPRDAADLLWFTRFTEDTDAGLA